MVKMLNRQISVAEDFDFNNKKATALWSVKLQSHDNPFNKGELLIEGSTLKYSLNGSPGSSVVLGEIASSISIGSATAAGKLFKLDNNGLIPVAAIPTVGVGLGEVYTTEEKSKLSGIASGATANETNAFLLARANHTGTTPMASTISDYVSVITSVAQTLTLDASPPVIFTSTSPSLTVLTNTPSTGQFTYRVQHAKGYVPDVKVLLEGPGNTKTVATAGIIIQNATATTHIDVVTASALPGTAWEIHVR